MKKQHCESSDHFVNRRLFLQGGAMSALGVTVAGLGSPLEAWAAAPSLQKSHKRVLMLWLAGGASQFETFDPKPDAPREIQGEMGSIPTSLPGVRFCEGLPRVAAIANELTVVRSMTHPYPVHGVAYAVSGIPTYDPSLEARPRDSRHWPYIGSVVDHLARKTSTSAVPRNIALPWMLNSKTDLLVNAGPFAAFLGQAHDPVWTDYTGKGIRTVPHYTDGQTKDFHDPFGGCTADGRFQLSEAAVPPHDVHPARLGDRLSLLDQFDRARGEIDGEARRTSFDQQREQAYSLITSSKVRNALDITREPIGVRESYGMTLFGQGCLAARRLVEAGSKFISVFWDGFGQFGNCAWDTHNNHYPRLKEYLLPGFDVAYSGLIRDFKARGLLDETLVMCISEHGRTPQIDSKPKGAGRHHWSRVYSAVFAGGGIARGKVIGASDKIGGDVKDCPVSPKDVLATSLTLLGLDPHATVPDPQGRPMPVVGDGQSRIEMIG